MSYDFKKIISASIVVIGILGSIASIYALFFSDKKVDIAVEVISETNVLNINTPLSNLDIFYKNHSLKKGDKELKLLLIRVRNNGNINILKNFFDDNDPFGVKLQNGSILEKPEIVQASNSYLKNHLTLKMDSLNGIYFEPIIFDEDAFFIIKALILTQKNASPVLEVPGKIAGINHIIKPTYPEENQELNFMQQVLIGGVGVQLVKMCLYFLTVFSLVLSFYKIKQFVVKNKFKQRRIKQIQEFKKAYDHNYGRITDVIFDKYKSGKFDELWHTESLLYDEEKLINTYRYKLELVKKKNEREEDAIRNNGGLYIPLENEKEALIAKSDIIFINKLVSEGFLIKENNNIVINKDMKTILDDFVLFTELWQYITRRSRPISLSEIVSKKTN